MTYYKFSDNRVVRGKLGFPDNRGILCDLKYVERPDPVLQITAQPSMGPWVQGEMESSVYGCVRVRAVWDFFIFYFWGSVCVLLRYWFFYFLFLSSNVNIGNVIR